MLSLLINMVSPIMTRTHITLFLLFCSITLIFGQEANYGLIFNSYEVEKEKRTSLNLTPEKPFSFAEGFTMSFDARFDADWVHPFGSVFRIITEERSHLDFMLSEIDNTGQTMVSFISSSHDVLFNQPFDGDAIDYGKYIHFEISIDIRNGKIEASVGNNKFSKQSSTLENFKQVNIVFGKSNYPRFQTTDVPAFSLKNLKIENTKGETVFSWPLSKHRINGVYDDVQGYFASCENAEWILDKHAIWKKKITINTHAHPQFCYNPDDNEIAIMDQDIFYRYLINTNELKEIHTRNNFSYSSSNSNNLIYNPVSKTYDCYLFELEVGTGVSSYDIIKGDWDTNYSTNRPPDYWQHNRLFSSIDNCLYLFFGYGHHKYKNEINRYDYQTKSWEKLSFKGDRIQPRYLCGLGMLDDQYAIAFGGYGSETGNQNISPQCFYNLFKINLRTLESTKVWEMENPSSDFVVANSLVPDHTGKSFYALAFPTQQFYTKLSLLKFSMETPEYSVVADSIPFNFEDVRSNADLFYDKKSNRLIALVASAQNNNSSEISVYTLSMPPLTVSGLYQENKQQASISVWLWIGIGGCLLIVIVAVILLQIKKKSTTATRPAIKETGVVIDSKEQAFVYEQPQKKAIFLFGGFQVFDKDGEDITREFTPMLRQLFILLLLNTAKNGKGISSVKLKDILWYDKSEESAKNNRGVFMNKLRQLFENIGTLQIKNQDIYWSVELGNDIYCDYREVLLLINKITAEVKTATKEEIMTLLAIVSKGELLPNIQTEWIDSFKSDFSNTLIDLLLEIYSLSDIRKSPQICTNLADAMFIHDSLNEDALSIKCSCLVQMGKYGLAQKAYNAFTKEYKALFNSNFPHSFERVINKA